MAKLKDYQIGRMDGLELAMRIVKESGVEGLEKEMKARGAMKIHTSFAKKDLEEASDKIKAMTMDTMLVISVATLRDEFGFGRQRLQKFIDRMTLKASCIVDDMATWNDYIEMIREETGIELDIRRND